MRWEWRCDGPQERGVALRHKLVESLDGDVDVIDEMNATSERLQRAFRNRMLHTASSRRTAQHHSCAELLGIQSRLISRFAMSSIPFRCSHESSKWSRGIRFWINADDRFDEGIERDPRCGRKTKTWNIDNLALGGCGSWQ